MTPRESKPIGIEGDVAFVTLTKGHFAIIDAADVPLVSGYNWYAQVRDRSVYAMRHARRAEGTMSQMVLMHRVICPPPSGHLVDHIDGNGLNNRRANLRVCLPAQNLHNMRRHKNRKYDLPKGVLARPKSGTYYSMIRVSGVHHYLGTFKTAEEAHAAYCDAATRFFGQFARAA